MAEAMWVGEAPGRLDFMGGVADYSGSLVLQTPIQGRTRVALAARADGEVHLHSGTEGNVEISLARLRSLFTQPATGWRATLQAEGVPHWGHYVLGCLGLFSNAHGWWPEHGLNVEVDSTVPTSMGVSSSAALEVATMRAFEKLSGKQFSGTELAKAAQRAENEVVGAPCGLMDQLASNHGVSGSLLPILCRPDILRAPVALPEGATVVGWPSGVKHSVSDSPYATARAAAFMGKRILEERTGRTLGHITELAPSQVRNAALPDSLSGEAFLNQYSALDDPLTKLDPERAYPVRSGALFPVEENFRCHTAELLLRSANEVTRNDTLTLLGELMFQSNAGYSSIHLDCPETDTMVAAVRSLSPEAGFYGARVSGGGSGGTVAVLLEREAIPQLEALAEKFGTPPLIM